MVDTSDDRGWDNKLSSELGKPAGGLRSGVVLHALDGVDGRVADLALNSQGAFVPEAHDYVGLSAAEHALPAEFARSRR